MGGAHSHRHGDSDAEVDVSGTARTVLLVSLALAAIATVVGVVLLWPNADQQPPPSLYAGENVTFVGAEVISLSEPCPVKSSDDLAEPPAEEPAGPCNEMVAELSEGESAGHTVEVPDIPPSAARAGLEKGDSVTLVRIEPDDGAPAVYVFQGTNRGFPVAVLAVAFLIVVALVARLRGLLAIVGLVFAGAVVAKFVLPALLAGESAIAVALIGSSAIMFVVLYLAHGLSVRTSTALAGTLVGIAIAAGIGGWAVDASRLSGITHDADPLFLLAPGLEFQGLLTAAVIIAGLGILNDVTITQSSAVWELRAAAPEMSRAGLFASGMRIGRDHIASTIYTIVFAYTGSALVVLLLIQTYQVPFGQLLLDDSIAEEAVRTFASAIALVLAVPVTTGIAAATVTGPVRKVKSEDSAALTDG
jgi:uncharacterized membrane protein